MDSDVYIYIYIYTFIYVLQFYKISFDAILNYPRKKLNLEIKVKKKILKKKQKRSKLI